jgi:hypothetical protein
MAFKKKEELDLSYAFESTLAAAGMAATKLERLPDDPWTFIKECCYTQDEHAKAKNLPYIMPMIGDGDDYLRVVVDEWEATKLLRIEKSRQLRITWLVCGLILHFVLKNAGARVGYQAKKFDDADAYLRDRIWFMYEHIPKKYRVPKARYVSGRIEVFHDQSISTPTAHVQALAEGPEQLRQYTFSIYWGDEFAFQNDQDKALTAAQPSLDGGGKGILTSSANGDLNTFYGIGHKDISPGESTSKSSVCQGIDKWKRNGWTTLRVHYTADPKKRTKEWFDTNRGRYSTSAWNQEMEIDFSVMSGTPVFCDTQFLGSEPQLYKPTLPLICGMDYSFLANCCITGQIRQNDSGEFALHILAELIARECSIENFAAQVLKQRESLFNTHYRGYKNFGDYAANQRTSTGTIITEMQKMGITLTTVPTGPGGVLKGIEMVQHLISFKLLHIDPSCAMLVSTIRSGYVWCDGKVDKQGIPIPSPEHPHSDIADALRYLCVNTFELQKDNRGGRVLRVKNEYRGYSDRSQANEFAADRHTRTVTKCRNVLDNVSHDGIVITDGYRGYSLRRKQEKQWFEG